MKKDFQKFQNDFYEEVENTLVNFNEHTHTLQIVEAPGIDGFPGMLEVLFGFVDVTGKDRLESQLIENTDDVTKAVAEFNSILKEDYPAFAQYKDLEDIIETAVKVNDPDNIYTVTVGDTDKTTGKFKVFDLTIQIREQDGRLLVWWVDRDDPDSEYEPYFDYDLSKWKPGAIVVDISFQLFDEEA